MGRNGNAGAISHYNTIPLEEIKKLPIQKISDKDSVCFLWAVTPQLPEAFDVLKSWGFKYKTTITWHKTDPLYNRAGLGYWFRGYTEHLLFGVKGKVKAFKCQKPNVFYYPIIGHSVKPDIFRRLIEVATKNRKPRIELFARRPTEGWDVWGNDEAIQEAMRTQ